MAQVLNIDTDELVEFTAALGRVRQRGLVFAARNTLKDTAQHVKQKTLLPEAHRKFTIRKKSFFKAFSRFDVPSARKLQDVTATVGMMDARRGKKAEQAGKNMTPRQRGGTIRGRSFIPLDTARTANNNAKSVRRSLTLGALSNEIGQMASTNGSRATTEKQRFIRTMYRQKRRRGTGSLVSHRSKGRNIVYQIVNKGGTKLSIDRENIRFRPIYTYKAGRSVPAGVTSPFTRRAALKSAKHMSRFYKRRITEELKRARKK